MKLFPAIDILDGQCVRLLYGDFKKVTIYGKPLAMALKWQEQGADYLHLVDLNGAKDEGKGNLQVIREMVRALSIPVQMGGGIRSIEDIDFRLKETQVERVILGTVCCQNPKLVADAIQKYGCERIVCGIDAKDGKVATHGWQKASDMTPIELGRAMKQMGVKYVVYTDISRDGALTGVNDNACKKLMQETNLNVIASGGVAALDDIKNLFSKQMYGVILGKALYENRFNVFDAVKLMQNLQQGCKNNEN